MLYLVIREPQVTWPAAGGLCSLRTRVNFFYLAVNFLCAYIIRSVKAVSLYMKLTLSLLVV